MKIPIDVLCRVHFAVDIVGYRNYPNGLAYKILPPTTVVSSVTAARTACSKDQNSSLPIPYENAWWAQIMNDIEGNPHTFYLGMTLNATLAPAGSVYSTDTGDATFCL
jgi:hypothetical protein